MRSVFLTCSCWLCLLAISQAINFDHVVSLGDSLLDDTDGYRSPVVAEHLANRLGAPLTKLAKSGSTSRALIDQGQHTQAAAQFGAGDLAVLWVGGNDFFYSIGLQFGISAGNYGAINTLEDNVDTILGTLRGAGLEVLVFNLPDMAAVPFTDTITLFQFQLNNVTAATIEWNNRLNNLATQHGAHVVDVFSLFADLEADTADYAIRGNLPLLGPHYDCQFCVFGDSIHPSSFAQGDIANVALDVMNAAYDPNGTMPLTSLSDLEIALLADLAASDFDGNGSVGASDLAVWQQAFGVDERGDATGDRLTNGLDLLYWQRQASGAGMTATSSSVPEPASFWLVVFGLLSGCPRRREVRNTPW